MGILFKTAPVSNIVAFLLTFGKEFVVGLMLGSEEVSTFCKCYALSPIDLG